MMHMRPSYNSKRIILLIRQAIARCWLYLSGKDVLTE